MSAWLIFSVLVLLGIGLSGILAIWPRPISWRLFIDPSVWLAPGLGAGICSFSFLLLRLAAVGLQLYLLLLLELAMLAGLGYAAWRRSQKIPFFPKSSGMKNLPGIDRIGIGILFLATLSGMTLFIANTIISPHGGWDAWSIWNLRARFFYSSALEWMNAFHPALVWSHPDYPLLLPPTVARLWVYNGQITQTVPAIVAGLFTFATLGILVSTLTFLRGIRWGWIGGLVLLGGTGLLSRGAQQIADIPLGFYILAAISLLILQEQQTAMPGGLVGLAGFFSGLAAWTKNEGLVFAILALTIWIIIQFWHKPYTTRTWLMSTLFFAGLLPPLFALLVFKLSLAPANDLTSAMGLKSLELLLNPQRYLQISQAFLAQSFNLLSGDSAPLGLLGIYLILFGIDPDKIKQPGLAAGVFTLTCLAGAYAAIFLLTPKDLAWHLDTALSRLFLHLWPGAVLITMLSLREPKRREE